MTIDQLSIITPYVPPTSTTKNKTTNSNQGIEAPILLGVGYANFDKIQYVCLKRAKYV